jgi:hypothetical protein
VLSWQRRRFREYWTRLSGRPTRGRPPINAQIKRHGRHRPALGQAASGGRDGRPPERFWVSDLARMFPVSETLCLDA